MKKVVTEALNEHLAPVRERRAELEKDPAYLADVLKRGVARARAQAQETLHEVHEALNMVY